MHPKHSKTAGQTKTFNPPPGCVVFGLRFDKHEVETHVGICCWKWEGVRMWFRPPHWIPKVQLLAVGKKNGDQFTSLKGPIFGMFKLSQNWDKFYSFGIGGPHFVCRQWSECVGMQPGPITICEDMESAQATSWTRHPRDVLWVLQLAITSGPCWKLNQTNPRV